MTTTPAAVAAKPVLHCFRACRSPQPYTRVRGISANLYTCDGCGATREIDELGVTNVTRALPGPPITAKTYAGPLPPFVAPTTRIYTNRRKENKPVKTTDIAALLHRLIDKKLEPIREELRTLEERLEKLEEKPDDIEIDETAVKVMLEKILKEQLSGATSGAHGRRTRPTDTADGHGRRTRPLLATSRSARDRRTRVGTVRRVVRPGMPADAKPYPVVRCTLEEATQNYNLHVQQEAINKAMALAVDVAMQRHASVTAAIKSVSSKLWIDLVKKYGLDPEKKYGTQLIDGKPYIVESPNQG